MKLKKLTLTNFKGIKSFEISPEGKSISVYGDNGTGKTTLSDAQHWLLFGIDSTGTKNFTPKPKSDGEDIHGMETSVEGTYQFDNDCTLTLKKTFSEVWKKKRGQSEAVFSGHTKEHFIDGVPVKENEYNDKIAEIAPAETLMSLSSAAYFSNVLPPEKRRRILLDITGNISDSDVISSSPSLRELPELLLKPDGSSYTAEELLKISKSRLTEINSRLKTIPARIDEASRAIPEETSIESIESELKGLNAEKDRLLERLHSSKNERTAELQRKIAEIQIELLNAEADYKEQCSELNKDTENQLKSIMSKKQIAMDTRLKADFNIIRFRQGLDEMEEKRKRIISEYNAVYAETWNCDTVCPTCGQPIPEFQIEESKKSFNLNKSIRLEEILSRGRKTCSKEMIAELKDLIERDEKDSAEQTEKIKKFDEKIKELNESMIKPRPFKETEKYNEIYARAESASAEMRKAQQDGNAMENALQMQLDDVNRKIDSIMKQKAAFAQSELQKARVSELEAEMSKLNEDYGYQSKNVFLCEEFIRAKTALLTDRINEKFSSVKFKLFETQINGGVKEICETLVPSSTGLMPYSYANHAAKINAGLDIIRVLSEHYGVKMPVFVDNAESIVNLCDSGLQVIKLIVSENDKKLRVEEN